jgi:hypothetical protein
MFNTPDADLTDPLLNINMKNEFTEIHNLLKQTTHVNKPMTFSVIYKTKMYVIKRMKHLDDCIENIIVNKIKEVFELNNIYMDLFISHYDISKKTNKVFKNKNNQIKYFLIMDYIPDSKMIFNDIDLLDDKDILYEYIKCALYRGIFRVTDFCSKNVLISQGKLYSIDENDINQQKRIIKNKDINNYIKNNVNKPMTDEIIDKFIEIYENKKIEIVDILNFYNKTEYIDLIKKYLYTLKEDIAIDLKYT